MLMKISKTATSPTPSCIEKQCEPMPNAINFGRYVVSAHAHAHAHVLAAAGQFFFVFCGRSVVSSSRRRAKKNC